MVLRAALRCWKCQTEADVILDDESRPIFCAQCSTLILETKKIYGYIYVLSIREREIVRILQGTVESGEPLKQQSGGRLQDTWILEARFASRQPEKDYKKISSRLRKYRCTGKGCWLLSGFGVVGLRVRMAALSG